ncbi:MAG: hypothetical protein IPL13_11045 [Saprospiraceae bacterium]|nr:hypothetical protein [Candidatus Brachybacter algidus]
MQVQKNKNSRLDILAQQAQNETQIITAENDIANGLLNLKQLMFVDASVNIDVIAPAVPIPVENPDMIDYELLVANSLKTQPQFQSFSSQINSALLGEKIAKSQGLLVLVHKHLPELIIPLLINESLVLVQ